ncbi:MAG: ferredoxin [Nitrospirae bacterium]|nr:ferredoxin [Nitrospirota bacterium]
METKFKIDLNNCTGCGTCEETAPEVFKVVNEKATINNSAINKNIKAAIEAKDSCPDKAIVAV